MKIRPAKIEDARDLAQIQVNSYLDTYSNLLPEEYLNAFSYEEQEEDWKQFFRTKSSQLLFIAENKDTILGYCLADPTSSFSEEYPSELVSLHIRKPYQRRGIGRSLFVHVVKQMNSSDIKGMFCWVLSENSARHFYERLGGRLVGQKPWINNAIFDVDITEVAYGWSSFSELLD